MMMKKLDNDPAYKIDLIAIEGDGSFPCPKCGTSISPEDETETNYKIVDTKVVNGELAELIISCGKCRSILKLTGFAQGL
ncbi:MAG TPA: hypothetical protein VLU95_05445 [Candidatus Acidoferrum sp.]|nr:hypothetical protein [Candidatus Acidoferrum sp.]